MLEDEMAVFGANLMKVALNWRITGEDTVNVMWFRNDSGLGFIPAAQSLVEVLDDFWTTIRPEIAPAGVLAHIEFTDWSQPNGQFWLATFEQAGTRAGGVASNMVAACISWVTPFTGRSFRGRNYFSGLGEERIEGNNMVAGMRTAFLTAASGLIDDSNGAQIPLIVASFVHNGLPRPSAVMTNVAEARVAFQVRTQRRRMPR
jgi:hypothetical protein